MPLIYLVRHGRVSDAPRDARDPELDALGQRQAAAAAEELVRRLPAAVPVLSSPLLRCRETAAPLLQAWRAELVVEPRVIEVPSPRNASLQREDWLRQALASPSWDEAGRLGEAHQAGYAQFLRDWRQGVLRAVLERSGDTVVFSHYVPINVLDGAALGTPRVISFRPANGSITVFETHGGAIRLVERGREVDSRVV